ncbi:phosphopyruvate hydratase [Microbacterium sp. 4R-513]|uniref:phosphopyruvate hydratase n=1 Tax=Microbacterium sp. 4R-513 TaxID=2567934 RepID=UPI0013E16942|nr:enolase C-terminal domain-like protein [Microbacterium sp. 4R-513]QIG39433.1 phosphopyruvate hydratase [Microbacterium sp. 4R-513]
MTDPITALRARRVWDSRGVPTVEIELTAASGARGRGIAPAGASTGRREALELRDGGDVLGGRDVSMAVRLAEEIVAPALVGLDVRDQEAIDDILARLDSVDESPRGRPVGGNTTTAASLAALHAAAASRGVPAWAVLDPSPHAIPRPQIQILGGGAHAAHRTAVQDFMVMPLSAVTIQDAFLHVAEVYRTVGEVLAGRGPRRGVADEGGHWPEVSGTEDALDVLIEGIERAGLEPGVDMAISLDIAATQFAGPDGYHVQGRTLRTAEWIAELHRLCEKYPIATLEDPAGEDDLEGMQLAVANTGERTTVVGDDFLVTDAHRIAFSAGEQAVDAVLIKVNQVGTVTGAARAVAAARAHHLGVIVSARSGESEDVSVAHLAVGWGADIVKVGSITRGERTAKWNELIRIDDALGGLGLAATVRPIAGKQA